MHKQMYEQNKFIFFLTNVETKLDSTLETITM